MPVLRISKGQLIASDSLGYPYCILYHNYKTVLMVSHRYLLWISSQNTR